MYEAIEMRKVMADWIEAKHLLPLLTKTAKRAYESFRQKPVPTIMMLKKATMISN